MTMCIVHLYIMVQEMNNCQNYSDIHLTVRQYLELPAYYRHEFSCEQYQNIPVHLLHITEY